MRHQNCTICSQLKDYERGFQKGGEGTFLPPAAEKLIVLKDLKPGYFELGGNPPLRVPSSRLLQLKGCPECRTCYFKGRSALLMPGVRSLSSKVRKTP